jgi:hypothetical protein
VILRCNIGRGGARSGMSHATFRNNLIAELKVSCVARESRLSGLDLGETIRNGSRAVGSPACWPRSAVGRNCLSSMAPILRCNIGRSGLFRHLRVILVNNLISELK